MPTITGVDEHGNRVSAPYTVQAQSSTLIAVMDPAHGVTDPGILGWQGCHSANDGYDSITVTTILGRQCFQYQTIAAGSPTGLKPTNTCKGARTDAVAVSGLQYNPVWRPPTAQARGQNADLSFWLSTSFLIPPGFPAITLANGGHWTLHEIFGSPFGAGPGWDLMIDSTNNLVMSGADFDGPSPTGNFRAYNPALKTFGQITPGWWYDFVFHFRMNTFHQATVNGIANCNVSNNDGWFECWMSKNQSPTFQVGSPVLMTNASGVYMFGTQQNVSRCKINFWVSGDGRPNTLVTTQFGAGQSYPQVGTTTNAFLDSGVYGGKSFPDSMTYHGIKKIGYQMSDVI